MFKQGGAVQPVLGSFLGQFLGGALATLAVNLLAQRRCEALPWQLLANGPLFALLTNGGRARDLDKSQSRYLDADGHWPNG